MTVQAALGAPLGKATVVQMRQAVAFVARLAPTRIALCSFDRLNSLRLPPSTKESPAMTRTPTTSVTAIALAARAFAWGILIGAHFSGTVPGIPPLSPKLA